MSFLNIEKLIEKMNNQNLSISERAEAAKLLGQTGSEKAVDALIDNLSDPQLRFEVVIALGRLANPKACKFLITAMFDSEVSVRLEIIKALRKIGDQKVVNPLIQVYRGERDENVRSALFILITDFGTFEEVFPIIPLAIKDPSNSIKMLALRYLSEHGDQRAANLLYPLLFHEDRRLKALAAETLWKFEGPLLLKRLNYVLLKTNDLQKRLDVVYVYGELGIIQEVEPLLYVMKTESNKVLLARTIEALMKIGDKRAIPAIVKSLEDEDEGVRMAAVNALASFKDPQIPELLASRLTDSSPAVREMCFRALEKIITPADIETIRKYMSARELDVRLFVLRMLGKIGTVDADIEQHVLSCIEDEATCCEALRTAGALSLKSAFEAVTGKLDAKSEDIRVAAALALEGIKDQRALPVLASKLASDESSKVRATIVNVIGRFGNKSFMNVVAKALKDTDSRVRSNAIEALEALGGEEIVELIFPLLEDANNRVKANAAKCLWKFGGIRMISVLENMLIREKDKWQRASAAYALGEIGSIQVVKPLLHALNDQEECVRANAIKALGKARAREIIPRLLPFLEDKDERVRQETIRALGSIGSLAVLEPLMNLIRKGVDAVTQELIVGEIRRALDHEFLLPLTKMMSEDSGTIRCIAADLLGEIGEDSTIPLLRELLKDGNVNIRNTAEEAIKKITRRLQTKNV